VGLQERKRKLKLKSTVAAIVSVLLGLAAPHAAAQGCAMCYQTAASSGAPGREALRHGILILLVPATSLFLGICGLIYHRRDQGR
jgi:hypothetical protein